MSLLQDEIKKHLEERGWGKSTPSEFAKAISIEAAELLEVFLWVNPTTSEVQSNPDQIEEARHEVADIAIFCIQLAVVLGFDFESAVLEKLELAKKKYPINKVRGRNSDYWRIRNGSRLAKKKRHENLH